LEVADVGRWIAYHITKALIEDGRLNLVMQLPIIYATENACLLHDIGNPPFGHFGEAAIKDWFQNNWQDCYKKSKKLDKILPTDNISEHIRDFLEFDGNPQGLRIMLRLQRDKDKYGLNLTYTTILSFIKYTRSTTDMPDEGLKKKPGYFETERQIVKKIKDDLRIQLDARFPLTYIMEAADDIAYCMSDIEDGIEKNVISVEEFFAELEEEWDKIKQPGDTTSFPFGDVISAEDKELKDTEKAKRKFFDFKTSYSRAAIERAKTKFLEHFEEIMAGSMVALFQKDSEEGRAIKCIKNVARRKLFRSPEAENPELAGYKIIAGLLDSLKPLLTCSREHFNLLLLGRNDPAEVSGKELDLHWRLFNKLPKKHLQAYEDQLREFSEEVIQEWHLRAHLVVDFVAGMTDRFALQLFQLLNGIRLN
jgi:dGTPase